MEQVVWTVVGLLAVTLFGTLFYLGTKIDSMNASLNGRIDALGTRIDGFGTRIDGFGTRIEGLGARIDALGDRLQAHVERHPS